MPVAAITYHRLVSAYVAGPVVWDLPCCRRRQTFLKLVRGDLFGKRRKCGLERRLFANNSLKQLFSGIFYF